MKADSGYLFVLQDGLNTCFYAAHGGTLSLWDSGSRFAVAGQNKVLLADGVTPAPGLKSIHFGSPNEYAFEYLMSGGENSLHVVMGLAKPDARGELALRPRPYAGKFFMSGAAAGRVLVFDPERALDPAQYHGNVVCEIAPGEWRELIGPFIATEARRRGLPLRVEGDELVVRLQWGVAALPLRPGLPAAHPPEGRPQAGQAGRHPAAARADRRRSRLGAACRLFHRGAQRWSAAHGLSSIGKTAKGPVPGDRPLRRVGW